MGAHLTHTSCHDYFAKWSPSSTVLMSGCSLSGADAATSQKEQTQQHTVPVNRLYIDSFAANVWLRFPWYPWSAASSWDKGNHHYELYSTISSKRIHQQEQLFLMMAVLKITTRNNQETNPYSKKQKFHWKWADVQINKHHIKRSYKTEVITVCALPAAAGVDLIDFNTYPSWTEDWGLGGSNLGVKKGYTLMAPDFVPMAISCSLGSKAKALGWWGNPCSTVWDNGQERKKD